MLFSRSPESHLHRHERIPATVPDTLPMFLEELCQPRLGYAQMQRFKAFPNFFAAGRDPGVVPPRFVPDQVFLSRLVPDHPLLASVPVEKISTLCICAGS